MAKANYDVIVIGAGFGGSPCAALLAKRGLWGTEFESDYSVSVIVVALD